ncbi:peptidase M36 [Photobacterium iliopiscarium]|jgi:subtilisin-like proprotein convertase family protein|uniref:proprotein convertase P-domain-containing protein n=1 Tax=Photobacterium iliopiscarium TaxID=56192 RepID=UPI000D15EE28|nr:proprotein convertase P-domain-containing protein [Photobacterium iliopiscarium]PST96405.1 peptidase M36 [Photobacterium iliopiscarium]
MNKKLLAVLIPSLFFTSTLTTAAELYFPQQAMNVESPQEAQQWVMEQYLTLSGKAAPDIVFDKMTTTAHALQYRFYQTFINAKACRSSVVVSVDRQTHTVNQLYTYLKTPEQCVNAREDLRQFTLLKPLANVKLEQQQSVKARMKVFDPDPVTQLQDNTLTYKQNLPEAAYYIAESVEVTEVNGVRYLANQRVQMVDVLSFDSDGDGVKEPSIAMSKQGLTTSKADFIANRDPNGYQQGKAQFLDTMAFYHIDKSIQYLESLGFDLFKQPLQVDALFGNKDNATSYGAQNIIVFGNGISADAEDGGVILHELAHMINYRLIDNWEEGDTGAIGEGLGDYWAAAYSYRYHPNYDIDTVFRWDGINSSRVTTRSVNDSNAKYTQGIDYPAHVIRNGSNVDQLWSTPLFSTLKKAVSERGEQAYADVDTIIWEGIAGLGAGVSIPQAAQSIVSVAHRLHPNDSFYADIFTEFFSEHNILIQPISYYAPQFLVPSKTKNIFNIEAYNNINKSINTAAVMVQPSLNPSLTLSNFIRHQQLQFEVDLTHAPSCGEMMKFDVTTDIDFNNGQKPQLAMTTLPVVMCQPILSIPVKDVHSTLIDAAAVNNLGTIAKGEKVIPLQINSNEVLTDNFAISLNVKHAHFSDLKISLIAPSGATEIPLFTYEDYKPNELNHIYLSKFDDRLTPLVGIPVAGLWQLKVIDRSPQHSGELISWGISNISGYQQPVKDKEQIKTPIVSQQPGKSGGSMGWLTLLMMTSFASIRQFYRSKKGIAQ